MKVAIDSGPLTGGHAVRGVGSYTGELIKALRQESKRVKGLEIVAVDFGKEDLSKYELIHFPYFNPFYLTLPIIKPTKTVITIHDLIPLRYPKQFPPGLKGTVRLWVQKYLLSQVDAVITVSNTSRSDISKLLPVKKERIHVVYEGVKTIYRPINDKKGLRVINDKYKLPNNFVLFIGDINYNKNIIGLIKACQTINIPLVISGKQALDIEEQGIGLDVLRGPRDWLRFLFDIPHPEVAHFTELVDYFKNGEEIIRPGYIPDEDLNGVINLATVYCQPSFYEGFGLPVLEAMVSGTPVVCAKTPALIEVAGKAALYADPKSPEDLAEKLTTFIKSKEKRNEYSKKGIKRAKQFSWRKAAKETITIYKNILANE